MVRLLNGSAAILVLNTPPMADRQLSVREQLPLTYSEPVVSTLDPVFEHRLPTESSSDRQLSLVSELEFSSLPSREWAALPVFRVVTVNVTYTEVGEQPIPLALWLLALTVRNLGVAWQVKVVASLIIGRAVGAVPGPNTP